MRALQEVHIKHFGPIVDGTKTVLDKEAFLRDCRRGASCGAARLWRSFVTTGKEGTAGWRGKFFGSTFLLGGVFRCARGAEELCRSPAALMLAEGLEHQGASRHVLKLCAAAHFIPYPQRMDARTDEANAARERAWLSCLQIGGWASQMAASGKWMPAQAAVPHVGTDEAVPVTPSAAVPVGQAERSGASQTSSSRRSGGSVVDEPMALSCSKGHTMLFERPDRRMTGVNNPTDRDATESALTCDGACGQLLKFADRRYACDKCDKDYCATCAAELRPPPTPPAATTATVTTVATIRPADDARLISFVLFYVDNGNASDRKTTHRFFKTHAICAVGVGGAIFPNTPIDPALSSELPTWVRAHRTAPREAVTAAQLAIKLGHGGAADAGLNAAAIAAKWHHFERRLSRLPLDVFLVREGHFSLAPLPADAPKPLGRLRFEARMIEGLASYPRFKERAAGRPSLRRLADSPVELVAQGEAALGDVLAARALPPAWVTACHILPSDSPVLEVACLSPPPLPPALEAAIHWDRSVIASYDEIASALGDSVWILDDDGALDARTTLARLASALDALPSAASPPVLVLVTREREVLSHRMLGGAGAEARRRGTSKTQSALHSPPLPPEHTWTLDAAAVGALVHARVRALVADNSRVYDRTIMEPMKTVHADTCSNRGMLEVLVTYAESLALPCPEIYRRLTNGYDSGKVGLEGDQLTKARTLGLLRKLAESMEETYEALDSLIATDPRRAQLLAILGKRVGLYQVVASFEVVNGHFHMHWHGGRVLAAVRCPLGLGVSSTLLGFPRFDASVPNFKVFDDLMATDFPALRISLLDQMLLEGRLPLVANLPANMATGHVEPHALLTLVFEYLDEKAASGDVITQHHCVALRASHEWLENGDAIRAGDKEFSDECMAPWLMPLHKVLGKFNEAMLCAEQAAELGRQSAHMRRALHVLFSHAITAVKGDIEQLADQLTKDLVHKRATDWVNERDVDMFKRAVNSFSNLAASTAERKSQKLIFLRHLREIIFELLGSRAGVDASGSVPPGRFDDILCLSSMYGARGANVWAGNPARTRLHDAMALAHFRAAHCVELAHLQLLRFVFNAQFGLPEVVAASDAALRRTAGMLASSCENAAASGLLSMALAPKSSQLAKGCVLTSVQSHELHAMPPPVRTDAQASQSSEGYSWAEVVAHWGLGATVTGGASVSLTTHSPKDMDSTSGSRLVPLMHSIRQATAAGNAEQKKREVFRGLLTRLVSDIDVLSNEYMEGMVAKSSFHGRHHSTLPTVALATQMTNETQLKAWTAEYHTKVVLPRFEANERREERAVEIVSLVTAAGVLAPTADDTVPMEETMFSASIETLLQLEAEATELHARATDAYRRNERAELICSYGNDALAARARVNREIVRLEGNLQSGILDHASSEDVRETMEATEFRSTSSPDDELAKRLLGELHKAASSAEMQRIGFVSLVKRSSTISSATRAKVVAMASDDLAKQATANSLAKTRATRKRKSSIYPAGSVELAQVLPDGAAPSGLKGMTVVYRGKADRAEWHRGHVVSVMLRPRARLDVTLSLERPGSGRLSKNVSLPDPRVRFLPSNASSEVQDEGSSPASNAPAPLPEETPATTFGLLEREHTDTGSHLASEALAACLSPWTTAERRNAEDAVLEPPSDIRTEPCVGDAVIASLVTAEGDAYTTDAVVTRIMASTTDDEDGQASIRIDGRAGTQRVALSELCLKGFLDLPLGSWGHERLLRQDARRLRPPPPGHAQGKVPMRTLRDFWLNTTIVNCLGLALTSAFPGAQVLSMGIGALALRRDFRLGLPRVQRICQRLVDEQKTELFGDHVEMWLLPMERARHIFGVAVLFHLRRIVVLDSCGGAQCEPSDARRNAQLLVHELHRLAGQPSPDWTGWKVASLGRLTPQQGRDAVNCGVYTMACFWALARRVPVSVIRAEDMLRWRERFLAWVLDGGAGLRCLMRS